jgi:hypothetical protein
MVIVLAVAALTVFAIAAVRFGRESREILSSPEHDLAGYGHTWNDLDTEPGDRLAVTGRPYATLALIERALGGSPGALTSAPNAAELEVRARELTAEYWSDTAWTTGIVSGPAFERVVAGLAPYLVAPAAVADMPAPAGRELGAVVSAA